MNRPQKCIALIGLFVLAWSLIYMPFTDYTVYDEGPTYAPIWQPPPPNKSESGFGIDTLVLSGTVTLVILPVVVLMVGLRRPKLFSSSEWLAICTGVGLVMAQILFPPEIGGSQLGPSFGTGFLFHHHRDSSINTQELDRNLLAIGFVTLGTLFLLQRLKLTRHYEAIG